MLEVVILKLRHVGKKDADLILPYLEGCDIFSPEDAEIDFETAEVVEREYVRALENSKTLDGFFSIFDLDSSASLYEEFTLKELNHVFDNGSYLMYLERYNEGELNIISDFIPKTTELFTRAQSEIYEKKDVGMFLDLSLELYGEYIDMVNKRDKVIGNAINEAEERIRNSFDGLRNKNPLKLVTSIGLLHHPERYTELDTTIVRLHEIEDPLYIHLEKVIYQGLDMSSLRVPLLKSALTTLNNSPQCRKKGLYYADDINLMDEDQAKKSIETLLSSLI